MFQGNGVVFLAFQKLRPKNFPRPYKLSGVSKLLVTRKIFFLKNNLILRFNGIMPINVSTFHQINEHFSASVLCFNRWIKNHVIYIARSTAGVWAKFWIATAVPLILSF